MMHFIMITSYNLHHQHKNSHYPITNKTTIRSETQVKIKVKMKILEDLKKQVEIKMQAIKKSSKRVEPNYSQETKDQLINLVLNDKKNLSQVAKELGVNYHHAKVIINDHQRKQKCSSHQVYLKSCSSNTSLSSLCKNVNVKRATFAQKKQSRRPCFIIQNSINNKVISEHNGYQQFQQLMIVKQNDGQTIVQRIP